MKNETRQDAFERITFARMGSLVNPTQEFLESLEEFIEDWREEINQAKWLTVSPSATKPTQKEIGEALKRAYK